MRVGHVLALALSFSLAAISASAADGAKSAFTIDGVLRELTLAGWNVSAPEPPSGKTLRVRRDLQYARRGAERLRLDVYASRGGGRRPAVLILHGGGWESGSRQMESAMAQSLAAKGFVAMPVSYRLGAAGRFPGAIHDVKAAVGWTRAHAQALRVDPDFIAIVGGSAGGHLATLAGASNGVTVLDDKTGVIGLSQVQAVIDIDGAANFPAAALIAQEEGRHGATSRFLGGNYAESPQAWIAASPLTYVSAASAPTLFIATNGATPILPGRQEMAARLRTFGVVSEIRDMPSGTPHPFWLVEPWFTPLVDEIARFLTSRQRELKANGR